jgi:hypothetical protein
MREALGFFKMAIGGRRENRLVGAERVCNLPILNEEGVLP